MFSLDRWMEVFDTIRRNKLRTALTAISVAWGIFLLVVLLGLGNGLNNGLRYTFRREATNGIWITANKTSLAHSGYDVGRRLVFDNRDYDRARDVQGIDHISSQYFIRGGQFGGGEMLTRRGTKAGLFQINAVRPETIYLVQNEIIAGRFLNESDLADKRKSVVVGRPVVDYLFAPSEPPIGQWIIVAGVPFEIVGVFTDPMGDEQARQLYIPLSTAQIAFHGVDHINSLSFTVGDANAQQAKAITDQVIAGLAERHKFSPDDKQAVRVHNNVEAYERFSKIFLIISIFVVFIGCITLLAGVVGISNIMMIAVKERTKEIGVRKALGATPASIILMITQEAVFLTSIAGLLGLAGGVALLAAIESAAVTEMIRNPAIHIGSGVAAAVFLILAGALAGFFPARAAARVNPIHTLRDE
ncbi:MAG: FtsX-like permease family protein [Deltaproteobacteria bacterium]|nr:MAG: FtsX-like permease family protein [Deltaproteobacteria bacterium]TMQ11727.1 MAG: FtsX-like permease family protein [Deltaproteobacteria bacterium]